MERIEVKESTVATFLRLRGKWLLNNQDIIVIREVQYQHIKPTEEEIQEHEQALPPNTTVFKRRKHKKNAPKDRFYITKLVANGYNDEGRYVGTYNEDWCKKVIDNVDNGYINLNKYQNAWNVMQEQIDAMTQYEKEVEMEREAEKSESEAKDQES